MNPYRKQTGKLIQVLPSGSTITLMDNKPWALLSEERNLLISRGTDRNTLKITNL